MAIPYYHQEIEYDSFYSNSSLHESIDYSKSIHRQLDEIHPKSIDHLPELFRNILLPIYQWFSNFMIDLPTKRYHQSAFMYTLHPYLVYQPTPSLPSPEQEFSVQIQILSGEIYTITELTRTYTIADLKLRLYLQNVECIPEQTELFYDDQGTFANSATLSYYELHPSRLIYAFVKEPDPTLYKDMIDYTFTKCWECQLTVIGVPYPPDHHEQYVLLSWKIQILRLLSTWFPKNEVDATSLFFS